MLPVAHLVVSLAALLGASGLSLRNTHRAECNILINGGLPEPQPLILQVGGSNDGFGFHLPADSAGVVVVAEGEAIRLACPGPNNYLQALGVGQQDVLAVCVGGTDFTIDGVDYTFLELACLNYPYHTARYTAETCYNNNRMIEIGFEVGTEFFRLLDQCFDETESNVLWSRFDCVSGIGGYQSDFPRPDFLEGEFYPGISPSDLYTKVTQKETVAGILGSVELANLYIHDDDDYYMSRGHLTAKADFVYGSQHRATFWYVNVAPQWQTFNGANWAQAEFDTRVYAGNHSLNLDIYTGTNGVTTLPDIDGVEQEIWLYVDENNNHALPCPKIYWKVVYEPIQKLAIALVGVNNPHIPNPELDPSYLICTSVCDQITWLKWTPLDIKKGYSYCCEVNDAFRANIPSLPAFTVSGILT